MLQTDDAGVELRGRQTRQERIPWGINPRGFMSFLPLPLSLSLSFSPSFSFSVLRVYRLAETPSYLAAEKNHYHLPSSASSWENGGGTRTLSRIKPLLTIRGLCIFSRVHEKDRYHNGRAFSQNGFPDIRRPVIASARKRLTGRSSAMKAAVILSTGDSRRIKAKMRERRGSAIR